MNLPLWLIPLAPVAAALLAGLLALTRRAEKAAPAITIAGTLVAGLTAVFARTGHIEGAWLEIPPRLAITLGVHLDSLAWLMVCVVTFVSTLVQIYSLGYMAGENGYARYYAYLSLFTASMLGLVVADNLFQLYVCWELVGICSYLLIGFWWFKASAANAAKKAFVVNRFGDVGFMLGVLLLTSLAGSFKFDAIGQAVARVFAGGQTPPLVSAHTFLWLAPLLLFCGAVGKSAQFPLHIWLPDAMEGPTPVSALIHAATMVAAGVYMVARLFGIFRMAPEAMDVVLIIGAITALMAATIALVQNDIKKVMAYSTISQLGYMMLALGLGGQIYGAALSRGEGMPDQAVFASGQAAGLFHLTTHAFFKALLFLAAGSVIHALHHSADPNNLQKMGGLRKKMPITAVTCAIGVLALAGVFPFAGFWSKDAILGVALETGTPLAKIGLAIGILVAALTAFYSARMWFLAFGGTARSDDAAHAHESPPTMWGPLVLLAVPSVLLGFFLHHDEHLLRFLMNGAEAPAETMHLSLAFGTTVLAVGGILLAARLYHRPDYAADPIERLPTPLYRAFTNLWYMDAFWNAVGARGLLAVGRTIAWVDRHVVDYLVANGTAWLCGRAGAGLRRTTTGQVQTYTAALLAAVVVAAMLLVVFHDRNVTPRSVTAHPRVALRSVPGAASTAPVYVGAFSSQPSTLIPSPSPWKGEGRRTAAATRLPSPWKGEGPRVRVEPHQRGALNPSAARRAPKGAGL